MSHFEHADERIMRIVREVIARMRDDLTSLELAMSALVAFRQPIPSYEAQASRFELPPRPTTARPRAPRRRAPQRVR